MPQLEQWFDNELLTSPQDFSVATSEKVPYSWDMSALIPEGESILTSPTVRVDQMTSRENGVEIEDAVDGTPTAIGEVVVATIDGSKLKEGKLYRVIVTINTQPGKYISCMTMMRCVA